MNNAIDLNREYPESYMVFEAIVSEYGRMGMTDVYTSLDMDKVSKLPLDEQVMIAIVWDALLQYDNDKRYVHMFACNTIAYRLNVPVNGATQTRVDIAKILANYELDGLVTQVFSTYYHVPFALTERGYSTIVEKFEYLKVDTSYFDDVLSDLGGNNA